jgi:hypothetical protein
LWDRQDIMCFKRNAVAQIDKQAMEVIKAWLQHLDCEISACRAAIRSQCMVMNGYEQSLIGLKSSLYRLSFKDGCEVVSVRFRLALRMVER